MKYLKQSLRYLLVSFSAVILVTLGIDAADKHGNISDSIIGKMIAGERSRCEEGMSYVPDEHGGFCVDSYEAAPGEACPIKDTMKQADTRGNLDHRECVPVSAPGLMPWRQISQTQAQTACAKAGKRLPTAEEWYLAALGTPDASGEKGVDDCQTAGNWSTQPGQTGSGKYCLSAYGAFDMVGNVWEWVKGEAVDGLIDGKELPESGFVREVDSSGTVIMTGEDPDENHNHDYFWIKNGQRGIARGGYWGNGDDGGVYANYIVSPSSYAGEGVGFRCVK